MADELEGRHKDVELIVAFLTARRLQLGFSQRQVAESAGMSQSSLSEIEAGVIPHPRADTLAKIADALGVHLGLQVDATQLTPDQYAEVIKLARELAMRGMPIFRHAT